MICNSCKLNIVTTTHYCPLCNIPIAKPTNVIEGNDFSQMFRYPVYAGQKKKRLKNTFSFVSIAISLLCIFINIFTWSRTSILWSLIIISSILFVNRSVFGWISSIKSVGSKIVSQYFLLAQLFLSIDIVLGYTGWSFSYVIPWCSIVITILITLLALTKRKNYTEFAGHLMASIVISVQLLVIGILPLSKEKWGLMAAFLCSIFTIIALYIFSKQQFKEEIKIRFQR